MNNTELIAKVLNLEVIMQHLLAMLVTEGLITKERYNKMVEEVKREVIK